VGWQTRFSFFFWWVMDEFKGCGKWCLFDNIISFVYNSNPLPSKLQRLLLNQTVSHQTKEKRITRHHSSVTTRPTKSRTPYPYLSSRTQTPPRSLPFQLPQRPAIPSADRPPPRNRLAPTHRRPLIPTLGPQPSNLREHGYQHPQAPHDGCDDDVNALAVVRGARDVEP